MPRLGIQRLEDNGWALGKPRAISILASTFCPQIQKPVVKTDTEQLAQQLEALAQAQVREQRYY